MQPYTHPESVTPVFDVRGIKSKLLTQVITCLVETTSNRRNSIQKAKELLEQWLALPND